MSEWGEKEWFSQKYLQSSDKDALGYYSYESNGYQYVRLMQFADFACGNIGKRIEKGALLDVGCATGQITNLIAKSLDVSKVVGFDFAEETVNQASANFPNLTFIEGALPEVDCPDKSFDLIIASEVLYYLSIEDRNKSIKEIHRALKADGMLLFSSAIGSSYFMPDTVGVKLFNPYFKVMHCEIHYFAIYHKLLQPLYIFKKIALIISESKERRSLRSAKLNFIILMSKYFLIGYLINLLIVVGAFIASNRKLPVFFEKISSNLFPSYSQSNFFILAKKENVE